MFANYHTHTARCKHAVGADRDYVKSAIQSGVKILGFSDHAPFPEYAFVGMMPDILPEYVASISTLREEFRNDVTMHIGLELEYDPKNFPKQLDFLKGHGIEYLILGQHALFGLTNRAGEYLSGSEERYLDYHCGLQREAMDTGLITYVAHPDMYNFSGSEEVYERHIRRLCRHARDLGIPLEINLLGLRTDRHYPRPFFWQIAGEEGCTVILGCDAHEPDAFLDKKGPDAAMELVNRFHLDLIQSTPIRTL
jgi:histidinol-phosphatase (PHP family)